MATYEILLLDPVGRNVTALDKIVECSYARTENDAGEMTLVVPDHYYPPDTFKPFSRVMVQRQVGDATPYIDLETVWFIIDGPYISLDDNGQQILTMHAMDALGWILSGINVAYNDNNSYTYKLDYADDMMKEIMRENAGEEATDTKRDLSAYLEIAADAGLAPIIRFGSFARQQVLDVLKDIANASANDDTPTWLGFDIVLADPFTGLLEFRTYIDIRGVDHRFPGGTPPVVVGPEYGNLSNVRTGMAFKEAASYVYAGGPSLGDIRPIVTEQDEAFQARSPFARREKFVDGGQISDPVALRAFAKAELRAARAKITFEGELVETVNTLRGVHWDFGDLLTAEWEGQTYEVRVAKVGSTLVSSDGGGMIETTRVLLRAEESLAPSYGDQEIILPPPSVHADAILQEDSFAVLSESGDYVLVE